MREIKFRHWSEKLHQYLTDDIGVELGRDNSVTFFAAMDIESHHVISEQFTGLRDRNGVEIYEGDIIEKTYGATYKRGIVIFDMGQYKIKEGEFGRILGEMALDQIFVAGNIHQHPNLLQ